MTHIEMKILNGRYQCNDSRGEKGMNIFFFFFLFFFVWSALDGVVSSFFFLVFSPRIDLIKRRLVFSLQKIDCVVICTGVEKDGKKISCNRILRKEEQRI